MSEKKLIIFSSTSRNRIHWILTVSIFMQFVPGGSIANLLARFGALEEEVFCNYTRQILEGVEFLHQIGHGLLP